MASNFEWTQVQFNQTLGQLLSECETEAWPRFLNRKAFFLALRNIPLDPMVEAEQILTAMDTGITVDSRAVKMGYVLAAKKASRIWRGGSSYTKGGSKAQLHFKQQRTKRGLSDLRAWRKELGAALKRIVRGRMSARGFMRIGWVSVLKQLAPFIGESYNRGYSAGKLHGNTKAIVDPAASGKLAVTIENAAHAKSEKRGGFMSLGEPPLEQAMLAELGYMEEHMGKEMNPAIEKFNSRQR
jgi:hypothetical protein